MSFQYIKKLEVILFNLACGLLFIDSLTGFFVLKIGVDIKLSIIYKILFLFIGLIFLLKVNIKHFLVSLSLLTYVVLWSISMNLLGSIKFLIFDFGESLKLVSTIIVFLVFSNFRYLDFKSKYLKLIYIPLVVLIINVLFSLVGIGSSSYGVFGAKGFFYAANALSGIIVLISSFLLVISFNHSIRRYIFSTFFFLILAAIIGTKSGILGVAIVSILLPISRFYITPKVMGAILIISPLVIILGSYSYNFFLSSAFYERIIFFYDTGGLTRAILSDRDLFFWDIFPSFISQDWTGLLWGFGFDGLSSFNKETVEIDPVDIIFIFGFFVMASYIVLMLLVFQSVFLSLDYDDKLIFDLKLSVWVSSIVLVLISSIAGHILFNGIVTFIWGATIALPLWRKNNLEYYSKILYYTNIR